MRSVTRGLVVAGLFAAGYACGTAGLFAPVTLNAQTEQGPSSEAIEKIKAAFNTLTGAMATLQGEQRYTSVTNGVNTFSVTVGGLNAAQDLEEGRGVDPETFAALYAGLATDEIKDKLGRDESGQMTYNGKVVRMYSVSRLKALFAERDKIVGLTK